MILSFALYFSCSDDDKGIDTEVKEIERDLILRNKDRVSANFCAN